MDIIEWAKNPWGQDVAIHIAWSLIWVAVGAGLSFFFIHAIYVRYFAKPRQFAEDASPQAAARLPSRIPRHSLAARLFHCVRSRADMAKCSFPGYVS